LQKWFAIKFPEENTHRQARNRKGNRCRRTRKGKQLPHRGQTIFPPAYVQSYADMLFHGLPYHSKTRIHRAQIYEQRTTSSSEITCAAIKNALIQKVLEQEPATLPFGHSSVFGFTITHKADRRHERPAISTTTQ
jgi:hypothetical protein